MLDVIGVICLIGVGVMGDVNKEIGDNSSFLGRGEEFIGVIGEVIRG